MKHLFKHRETAVTSRTDKTPRKIKSIALVMATALLLTVLATFATPRPASATNIAPQWLVNYIYKRMPGTTAQIMGGMGFHCAGTPYVCWTDTSYDPPRWFYYGVVQTGNGASGYLNARGWPATNAPVIRTFPENWKLVLFCQTTGPSVYGRWGWTNVWDYVGHNGDAPMFVSDGFVYTGSNGFVAGACDSTNYGGNPI
jgi:hypothetical protein